MAEESDINIYWTERSLKDALVIRAFLLNKFSEKELNNFYKLLQTFEKLVKVFPELYQASNKNNQIRRAVLSKQLSVFYSISKGTVAVIGVLDNRMDESKHP